MLTLYRNSLAVGLSTTGALETFAITSQDATAAANIPWNFSLTKKSSGIVDDDYTGIVTFDMIDGAGLTTWYVDDGTSHFNTLSSGNHYTYLDSHDGVWQFQAVFDTAGVKQLVVTALGVTALVFYSPNVTA